MSPLKLHRSSLVLFLVLTISLLLQPVHASAQQAASLPGQFAYVEDGKRLYLVRGDVQDPLLVLEIQNQETVGFPRFSRDGRYLAYCLSTPSNGALSAIYALDTLTFEKQKVTTDGSCSYDWSPDGKTLIYATPPALDGPSTVANGIWAYTRESGEIKLLIPSEAPVIDPRWSPDGSTISYYDFCFECVGDFHTYDPASTTIQDWPPDTIGPEISWAPDGRVFAYDKALWMYSSEGQAYGLGLAGRNGEIQPEIYSQPGQGAFFPLWSPDGKRIAFASFESFVIGNYINRRADLMTVAPDGTNPQKPYSSIYEVFPQAWSPDSRYLLLVEPQSIPQDAVQEQQLILLDMQSGEVVWQVLSTGALTADWAVLPTSEPASPERPSPMAGKTGLLFAAPDYALSFLDPASGQVQRLTAPFTGKQISLSPDGRTVLFGNQIVSMQSQTDGTVTPSIVQTSNPSDFSGLNWSPDSQKYGYVEAGRIWMVNLQGNRAELAEGSSPPDWSQDGRWMAYCDKEGRLWIADSGKPADWIVQQTRCQVRWSPAQSILAYVTFPAPDFSSQANGTAFLYDPLSGRTKEVAQAVSGVDWSPDGKLVSIQRLNSSPAGQNALSAVNPETGQELLIEDFSAETTGNRDWIGQSSGYLAGKFRFQADLLAKEQVAEILFDATRDSSRLLIGSGEQVICRDAVTNTELPIADMSLNEGQEVHARFSPDGQWILVSMEETGKTVNWIAQCSAGSPAELETQTVSHSQYFSPDSRWLVMEQTRSTGENVPNVSLLELESGQAGEVPAGLQTNSAWFQMPAAPVLPASKVADAAGPLPNAGLPTAGNAINLMSDAPPVMSSQVVTLSILLWASALVAIVILMLYLWRRSPGTRKTETPIQEKPVVPPPPAATATGPIPEDVETAFQQGVEFVRNGNAEQGIAELTRVITAEPGNDVAWFWLGIASARQNDYRSAERCFLQAKRHGHPEADKALEWLKGKRK